MAQRIVHSIDGKSVSKSRFREICEAKENKFTIIGDKELGNHSFSSFDQYDDFLRSHPATASAYLNSLHDEEIRQTTIKKLGRRKAMSLNKARSKLFGEINETLARFTKEAGVETIEEEASLLRSMVSPKMGSVYFFASPNFSNPFAYYEGLTHSDVEFLDEWDNRLNSILLYAYGTYIFVFEDNVYQPKLIKSPIYLTIYEDACHNNFDEQAPRLMLYCPSGTRRAYPDLGWLGWGNRVSSWSFWSWSS